MKFESPSSPAFYAPGAVMANPNEKVYMPKGQAGQMFRWVDGLEEPPEEVLVEGPAGTGKSRAIGEFLYEVCSKYANTKVLVLRRFRADLHKGFQRTWEDMVLFPGHELLTRRGGGQGNNREHYSWPNGSMMVLGHMEDPQRWYSSEWDIVYWNEVNEARLDQWERLDRSLRKGDRPTECPWRLKMGDTNPDSDRHWIHRRCKVGRTMRIVTRHKDNPSLEPKYLERLAKLTGVRYRRLFLGEWCAAEGQIWDNFDSERHIVQPSQVPELKWHMAGMDFGHNNPGCILVGGFDEEGTCYLTREVYRQGEHIEWWAKQLLELNKENPLSLVIADCADGGTGAIKWLNERLGLMSNDGRGLVQPVRKRKVGDKRWGFASREHVRSLLDQDLIRVLDDPYRLVSGADKKLLEKGVPTSLTDEIPQLVYRMAPEGRELNVDMREDADPMCADHACDALIHLATTAWAADFTPDEVDSGLPDDSMGALLKHDEVWADPDPYANLDTSFDPTPAGAFVRPRRMA